MWIEDMIKKHETLENRHGVRSIEKSYIFNKVG